MRTLKTHEYEIERESIEEQLAAGRYNPALVVTFRGHRCTLGAGTTDTLHLFEEGGTLFALSGNDPLGYMGLQAFCDGEEIGDTFAQDHDEHTRGLFDLTPIYRAKRLADYCDL